MSEFNVELLDFKIKKLNINVEWESKEPLEMQASHSARMFEPTDESDPTVLVKADCKITDKDKKDLSIDCSADFVFKINPIPENRGEVASRFCPDIIRATIEKKALEMMNLMGYKINMEGMEK